MMNHEISKYVVIQDLKTVTTEALVHFVEQPYIEQLWITVAYNVLNTKLEDDASLTQLNFNNHFSNTSPNKIEIRKSIFLSEHIEHPFLKEIEEFRLYRGKEEIQGLLFYTILLKTVLTSDIQASIIKKILQNIIMMTSNPIITVLFAIVTPDAEWHIGVIEIRGCITIYQNGFSEDGNIQYKIFSNREKAINWLIVKESYHLNWYMNKGSKKL